MKTISRKMKEKKFLNVFAERIQDGIEGSEREGEMIKVKGKAIRLESQSLILNFFASWNNFGSFNRDVIKV